MKIKDRWVVLECPNCKRRTYWYLGDEYKEIAVEDRLKATEFEEGYSSNCSICDVRQTIIPYEEWKEDDIAEIFGNELENRNHHWLTYMPYHLINALNNANIPIKHHSCVMRFFMEEMSNQW